MQQRCSLMWLLCLIGLAMPLLAQDLQVAGKVVIEGSEDPLPGVTVAVKGTTLNTVSDNQGSFSLTIPGKSEATLEFSFVGFKAKTEIISASNTNMTVALAEAPLEVSEEMVITGFASSVKRKNLANAVATISEEKIGQVNAQTLDGALGAKFAGVTVSANNGAPGGGFSVNLRGISTINGNAKPLYVVDGVIVSNVEIQSNVNVVTAASTAGSNATQDQPSNRVADFIPSDIANIEILKGPSAAALYGSKASNGVVIITTKGGQVGKPKYEFKQSFGQRSIIKKLGTRRFTQETANATYGSLGALFDPNVFIDYEDEIYGNKGDIFETSFSAAGGNDKTRYYFSGNTLSDDGIIARTGYEKSGMRANLEHNFTERLSASLNMGFVNSKGRRGLTGNDNTGVTYGISLSSTPSFFDLRPTNGAYPANPFGSSNAVHTRDLMTNVEEVNRTTATFKLDYNAFESANQALDFNLTAGMDFFSMESDARFPADLQFEQARGELAGTSVLGETESEYRNLYLNGIHTLFAGNNTFTTTAGIQFESQNLNALNVAGSGSIGGHPSLDNQASINVLQGRVDQQDRGFFVQEEVNLGETIFLTAGVRGDSSSANGDESKFYIYPKASASIRLSEYDFWKMDKYISEFKLRVAWGETGNLPNPAAKYSGFTTVNIDGLGGLIPSGVRGNPDIEPETSTELEVGFDATLLDGKGTIEFTHFKQDIADLLLFGAIPPSSGATSQAFNGGEMEIEGWEFLVRWNPIKTNDFDWTFGLNYYSYEQVVTKLGIPAYNTGGFADFLGRYRLQEGWSPTTIIGADRDANGNFIPLGDETPDYQIGWDNEFKYKTWSLAWLLDIKEGGDVINLTKLLTDLGGTTADLDTNPNAGDRLNSLGATTVPWVEDGSYVRLREIVLRYGLPRTALARVLRGKLSHLDFSISGRNIKTWTDYSSYDPEVSNFGTVAIGRSVEVTPFPSSKAWYANIAFGF